MKRPTWILLVILLVLVGLLIYLNREHNLDTVAESTPVDQVEFLFSDTDGLPTGISISANQGDTVTIKRAEDGSWNLSQPRRTRDPLKQRPHKQPRFVCFPGPRSL